MLLPCHLYQLGVREHFSNIIKFTSSTLLDLPPTLTSCMIRSFAFRQIPCSNSPARSERDNESVDHLLYKRGNTQLDTEKDSGHHISKTKSRSSSGIGAFDSSSKELSNELLTKRIDGGLHPETLTPTWTTPTPHLQSKRFLCR